MKNLILLMVYVASHLSSTCYCVDVTVMLSAPQEVLEEEGSVIRACVSIDETALLEREINVMFFTMVNPRNSQGIVELLAL